MGCGGSVTAPARKSSDKITLNNEAYTAIGVTAPDFQFPRRGEIPSYFHVTTKPDLICPP
jgi:hypothetical protein